MVTCLYSLVSLLKLGGKNSNLRDGSEPSTQISHPNTAQDLDCPAASRPSEFGADVSRSGLWVENSGNFSSS